ncbi:serine/threonine-protein kinase [Actinoplanes awajinensis]|uniref:serine/threonine-protein kinase n=1 Tax=Actinoplanes awajinensis TaxID=135946 RepID=UPI0012FA38A0|nr:serine/threonine-protein kinase [Actinoplanes awajinensis]
MQSDMGLQPGVRLGNRYRLEDRISAGATSEEWRAVDESQSRTVAVEISPAGDPDRFTAAASALARIDHPAVVKVLDAGLAGGFSYLVTAFTDGESLAQRLARTGRLAPDEAMRILAAASEGVQAAHDQDVLHGDLTTADVRLGSDGGVTITGFALARPGATSPEQAQGRPGDRRSDVYALGKVAQESLGGDQADVPAPVLALVHRALADDPEQRWPSALVLADVARQVATEPEPEVGTGAKSWRRNLIAAVVAVLVVGGIIAGIAVRGGGDTDAASAAKPTASAGSGVPAGFSACGDAFCPTEPMCWNALVQTGTQAMPPVSAYCPGSHVWETFLAIPLPDGPPVLTKAKPLIKEAAAAKACSAAALKAQSKKPAATVHWIRAAWPVEGTGNTWLLHCIAQPKAGTSTGAVFAP